MNKKLVNIIVNCYNGEKYLKKNLESIQRQKYSNWELIFWDNQSSDNSKKIFDSFKDKRFKYYYQHSKHTGTTTSCQTSSRSKQYSRSTHGTFESYWCGKSTSSDLSTHCGVQVTIEIQTSHSIYHSRIHEKRVAHTCGAC